MQTTIHHAMQCSSIDLVIKSVTLITHGNNDQHQQDHCQICIWIVRKEGDQKFRQTFGISLTSVKEIVTNKLFIFTSVAFNSLKSTLTVNSKRIINTNVLIYTAPKESILILVLALHDCTVLH